MTSEGEGRPAAGADGLRPDGLLPATAAVWGLLFAPFASYLKYNGYSLWRAEVILCAFVGLGLAIVAAFMIRTRPWAAVTIYATVITILFDAQVDELDGTWRLIAAFGLAWSLLWLIRAHATRVVSLAGLTLAASTIALPGPSTPSPDPQVVPRQSVLPFVLHIVLDEHIGIEGLPADIADSTLRDDIRNFFTGNGFRLFGGAYSEFNETTRALSQLLNMAPGRFLPQWFVNPNRYTFALTQNAYFARLVQQGYSVEVVQSSYLDLCAPIRLATCHTYNWAGLAVLADLPVSVPEKSASLLRAYRLRLTILSEATEHYQRVRERLYPASGSTPGADLGTLVSTLNAMSAFRELERRVKLAQQGDYLFAHLLLPHFPYSFDEHCEPTSASEWLTTGQSSDEEGLRNTPETRRARYRAYLPQLRCTHQQLEKVIRAIPESLREETIVVVHGDHGSRISELHPSVTTAQRMSVADFRDNFSTLFAVRSPAIGGGYSSRAISISCLLSGFVDTTFTAEPGPMSCESEPRVYVMGRKGSSAWIRLPLLLQTSLSASQGQRPDPIP